MPHRRYLRSIRGEDLGEIHGDYRVYRVVDKSVCHQGRFVIMEVMANQQLVDYIKQQLQLGVSKEAIRATLSQAGWPEADINEALSASGAEAAQSPSPVQPSSPAMPAKQAAPSVPSTPAVSVKPASSVAPASALSQFAQKPAVSAPQSSPFVTKDIFQPEGEPTFQPKIQPMSAQTAAQSTGGSSLRKYIIFAVGIVAVLGFAGWSAYLFWQNGNLKEQISQGAGLSSALEEANAQVASLTNEKNSLASQLDALNLEKTDLLLHLSFFIAPAGEATTTDVSVSGTLGGDKKLYTVTTNRQVVLSVKNSSDKDVAAALQPLLGNEVKVSGTYVPGTREITVTGVNGAPVKAPSSEPAETPTATSTPPAPPTPPAAP